MKKNSSWSAMPWFPKKISTVTNGVLSSLANVVDSFSTRLRLVNVLVEKEKKFFFRNLLGGGHCQNLAKFPVFGIPGTLRKKKGITIRTGSGTILLG